MVRKVGIGRGQAPVKPFEAARNPFQFDDEGLNQAATPKAHNLQQILSELTKLVFNRTANQVVQEERAVPTQPTESPVRPMENTESQQLTESPVRPVEITEPNQFTEEIDWPLFENPLANPFEDTDWPSTPEEELVEPDVEAIDQEEENLAQPGVPDVEVIDQDRYPAQPVVNPAQPAVNPPNHNMAKPSS